MNEPKYICLSDGATFYYEDELRTCRNCGEVSCHTCGLDIHTINDNTDAMRLQENERKLLAPPK